MKIKKYLYLCGMKSLEDHILILRLGVSRQPHPPNITLHLYCNKGQEQALMDTLPAWSHSLGAPHKGEGQVFIILKDE